MPRDGSGVYSQPFPNVTEGTTIESTVYNGYTADITLDLNSPRPVVAGGTGAPNADAALDNLKAEKFKQVVTNWDTTVWRAGSFYAATTAIGSAPVASHAFAGIVYYANATDLVIEATDLTDPASPDQYIKVMTAGVWGAWVRLNPNVSSANLGEYNFNNQVTFPPGSGQIRFNNATQNSTTEVFISHLSATGVDNSSQIATYLTSGVDFIIQDKDEGNKYKVFTTTAAAVLSGGDYRVTAALKISGIDLVSAQRILVTASSEAQRVQQRQLIYAAPFDALAYNGMQINGSMDVSQEKGTTATVTSGYVCDGWALSSSGTMVISGAQALNGTQISGIPNCLVITVTTAQASISAGHLATLQTKIEGYRVARLGFGTSGAGPITVGFWTAHARTGTYSVSVRNAAGTRSCVASYTQNTINTWEYKTVTFPGCTDGGWANDNAAGLMIDFSLAAGTTFTAPAAGTWYNTNYVAAPGQINAVAATSDAFRITGVVVLPGIEVPSAARAPLIMRPYDQELVTCRRYYYKRTASIISYGAAGGQAGQWFMHPVDMRAAPTMTPTGGTGAANTTLPGTIDNITPSGFTHYGVATAAGTIFMDNVIQIADARL